MEPLLVFLGIAVVVGCLIRGFLWLRLRAASRQPEVTDADLCQLRQANRISSRAIVASLVGVVVVGLAVVVL